MSEKIYSLLLVLFIGAIILSCGSEKAEQQEFQWGNLKNLGPNINSPGKDEHVSFTPDGKTMYFASIREEGMGKYDIYTSRFKDGEWSPAELLPPPINTLKDEYDPFITLDGTELFFASNRDNSEQYWDCEIYISEWDGEKWSEPVIYDRIFVTPDKPDWGVTIPRDFQTFIFSSGREPARPESVQLFQSIWQGDKWSQPEALPEPVNSGGWEATPYITTDGKTLYLCSDRGEENKQDVDIWRFDFINGQWTNPQLMRGPFLSDKHDYDPCISPDGTKFYFTSDRDGGFGDSDIYVVEKIFKK